MTQKMSAVIVAVFQISVALFAAATLNTDNELFHPNGHLVSHEYDVNAWHYDTMDNGSCSNTWFYPKHFDNGSTVCECGSDLGFTVDCDPTSQQVKLDEYYCMTYDNDNTSLIVGKCNLQCFSKCFANVQLNPLPSDPSQLEEHCGQYGRTGQLCGRCKDGYVPPAYSYNLTCVECIDYRYNWVKYMAAAYLPLSMFFIIVIVFRVSVTSGLLDVYILFCQVLSSTVLARLFSNNREINAHPRVTLSMSAIASFCGIWNLDFFRLLYPPFCMHPKMTTLHVLILDYAIAVYPLLLIVTSYILVELHDNNFRLIVWLWKPFHRCLVCFRREWNIKKSLIDAFCTFLLLSYVKFLSVSFDLLFFVKLFNVRGETLKKRYLFYDGTLEYFGSDHLPFGILALVVFLVFNVVPLVLLCLYPWRCFHRCLNRFKIGSRVLNTLMDAFQGCYKDGTSGTRDCRWFAGFYLMIRIALLIIFSTLFQYSFIMVNVLALLLFYLIAVFRPYKSPSHNAVNQFLIFVGCILCVMVTTSQTVEYIITKA